MPVLNNADVCFRIDEIPEDQRQSGIYRGDRYQIVLCKPVPGTRRPLQENCQELLDQLLSCSLCRQYTVEQVLYDKNVPEHRGSMSCTCGSIASGGTVAHCSCGRCF